MNKDPVPVIDASSVKASEPAIVADLVGNPQFQQLFEQFPALRPRLRWIFDASTEQPDYRPGPRYNRSKTSNDSFNSSKLSPERRLARTMHLLDKELKAPSAKTNGIKAFAEMVAQLSTEEQDSS
ncbi:uncharacterized protein A1O9_01329 [Exophiala aquamarina CBS 119918]|uniref:Uncharacterized protein n=1 Tax=Exophiala aquamarina CBS 119918 TaxID=1182545 RepID=A0A072PUE8_9EURO|nr:uncharacterized protein A1O9_01329 [Exophiala aquamarina CBS 119918]KEF63352.1 hypothetical protein A1O9_01329 [Exophiala aquamarina CBS 119918]